MNKTNITANMLHYIQIKCEMDNKRDKERARERERQCVFEDLTNGYDLNNN